MIFLKAEALGRKDQTANLRVGCCLLLPFRILRSIINGYIGYCVKKMNIWGLFYKFSIYRKEGRGISLFSTILVEGSRQDNSLGGGKGQAILPFKQFVKSKNLVQILDSLDQQSGHGDCETYAALLQDCCNRKALSAGKRVHFHIIDRGLTKNTYLGNLLISMYSKCGSLEDARRAFDTMPEQDIVSWTALISAYAQNGHGKTALQLFRRMQQLGLQPNNITFVSVLHACCNPAFLQEGKSIHAQIVEKGLLSHINVGNSLVRMYSRCGSLQDAIQIFDQMSDRDVASWNAIIAAYIQYGQGKVALQTFKRMQQLGVNPSKVTFISILSACSDAAFASEGKLIHFCILNHGLESDLIIQNALVNMYSKCGLFDEAHMIFDKMPNRNVVSWTSMIAAYASHANARSALQLFRKMQLEGIKPDRVTYVTMLDTCSSPEFLPEGQIVHALVSDCRLESDLLVGNALVNMYGKCGLPEGARDVFRNMIKKDVISWTTMIAAYVQNGRCDGAHLVFEQMLQDGVKPNKVTFVSIFSACITPAYLSKGKRIHNLFVNSGYELDAVVGTALVDMYGKCGSLQDAHAVFKNIDERDLVSWNAIMTAYAQHGHCRMALQLLGEMQQEGLQPDEVSFSIILEACADRVSLAEGKLLHTFVNQKGLEQDVPLAATLVYMYYKCGSLHDAFSTFIGMHKREVRSWNAVVAAFAQHGHGSKALQLFGQMQWEEMKPTDVTLVGILSACSHTGLVDSGCHYFFSAIVDNNILPTSEIYGCMIDILGRAGKLDEAEDLMFSMPFLPDDVVLTILLGACRVQGDIERGARAAEKLIELDPLNPSSYIVLSNMYASVGRWEDVARVRKAMELRCALFQPVHSS
ncbi:hypothetical protein O6H91_15G089400 [Diphasiastrum complanatum]|uniref:Uncharacterized protein n=1 Tax=Diphasiastrum complanatum TaxID=34168 RepID=A0ACC2BKJ8_DIPCM|nr:hypothetical protein O6H91_15G089400 [Diphasiastrum complanatum]